MVWCPSVHVGGCGPVSRREPWPVCRCRWVQVGAEHVDALGDDHHADDAEPRRSPRTRCRPRQGGWWGGGGGGGGGGGVDLLSALWAAHPRCPPSTKGRTDQAARISRDGPESDQAHDGAGKAQRTRRGRALRSRGLAFRVSVAWSPVGVAVAGVLVHGGCPFHHLGRGGVHPDPRSAQTRPGAGLCWTRAPSKWGCGCCRAAVVRSDAGWWR